MTCTVIVITLNRPDFVRRCLTNLFAQEPRPDQIIVVDSSAGDRTKAVVGEFADVMYLRNPSGFGRMTSSRNIALKHAAGEIIAFVDDDAFVRPGWLKNLLASYQDVKVGAVGGRACNGLPGEELVGADQVGQLRANGSLTGNFAADPHQTIDVDHIMGCNMSYRKEVIARLGGFREDYPGISGVREDSDMSVRVKLLGWRIVFNPQAIVDHVAAPQAVGRRFDARYEFYIQRNHLTLLIRNFGLSSPRLWRYFGYSAVTTIYEWVRRCAGATVRLLAIAAGTVVGIYSGIHLLIRGGRRPDRIDPDAQKIRAALDGAAPQSVETWKGDPHPTVAATDRGGVPA